MNDRVELSGTPRRKFLDWLIGTTLGSLIIAVVYPVGRYIIPPATGELATAGVTLPCSPDEIEADSGRIFKFGSRPGIVIRTPRANFAPSRQSARIWGGV
jgi:hypothetical protein